MAHHEVERNPDPMGKRQNRRLWLFLGLLIIGAAGYFTLRGHWAFYGFAHAGAIGVLGLFGIAAGAIAGIKGYNYTRAFLLAFLLPVFLGIGSVLAIHFAGGEGTPFYCGGSVSLAVAILILLGYSLIKKKPIASR